MTVTAQLDRFQRRHPWAGFPLAVVYKYFDDFGPYLAGLLTYYGVVSLFPLLLLASTILGIVLVGHPNLQHELIASALHQFPGIGNDLATPKHIEGGTGGLVIGIVGSLYGGLGVAQAFQYACNTVWGVPRNSRPNPFRARGRGLLLLGTAGLAILGTTVLSILGGTGAGELGWVLKVICLAGSVFVNVSVYIFAFRIATARPLTVRDVAPGAIAAAIIWQLLQSFGVIYVTRVVNHASPTNKLFALVLGLVAFLFLTATVVVLCVEINVVRVGRLHPRSLMTPFTDNVVLTSGDRRAYVRQAKAQRSKGFQRVHVTFDQKSPGPLLPPPQPRPPGAATPGPAAGPPSPAPPSRTPPSLTTPSLTTPSLTTPSLTTPSPGPADPAEPASTADPACPAEPAEPDPAGTGS